MRLKKGTWVIFSLFRHRRGNPQSKEALRDVLRKCKGVEVGKQYKITGISRCNHSKDPDCSAKGCPGYIRLEGRQNHECYGYDGKLVIYPRGSELDLILGLL
jgi:hypothetical protein